MFDARYDRCDHDSQGGSAGRRSQFGLPFLIVLLAVTGAVLWRLGGVPRLPHGFPAARLDPATLRRLLTWLRRGPSLADVRAALPWLFLGAWFVWSWLVLSVALQLAVAGLDLLTRGARWVRALRPLVDLVSARVARRVVTGATASFVFVRVLMAGAAPAAAAPARPALTLMLRDPANPHAGGILRNDADEPATSAYVVQPGDSLAAIAEHVYGDPAQYTRLVAANRGRIQADGRPFAGVLTPGQILVVPAPQLAAPPSPASDRSTMHRHVVRPGETLRGIAQAELGDERRWHEFTTVDGTPADQLPDPDLIHPGDVFLVPDGSVAPETLPAATVLTLPERQVATSGPVTIAVTRAPDGTPVSVIAVGHAAHGQVTLAPDGAITYTPFAGYRGPDRFSYTVQDDAGHSGSGSVAVAVSAAETPAGAALAATPEGDDTLRAADRPPHGGAPLAWPTPVAAAPSTARAATVPAQHPPSPTMEAVPTLAPADMQEKATASVPFPAAAGLGGGMAALAVVGGVALRRRRHPAEPGAVVRRLRRAPAPSWSSDPAEDPEEFERADLAHAFAHRQAGGEGEPATLVAAQVAHHLAGWGHMGSVVLLAAHERQLATVTVRGPAEELRVIAGRTGDLARRLGGPDSRARAILAAGGGAGRDLEVRFTGLSARGLLAPLGERAELFLPLAALPSSAALIGNADALGHVLVAGLPGDGAADVLTTLVAELAARQAPADLRLYAIAARRALPGDLLALPHWARPRVDPDDADDVRAVLDELGAELAARRRRRDGHEAPLPEGERHIILVLGELAALPRDGQAALGRLGVDGPACGIQILAATARAGDVPDPPRRPYCMRLVRARTWGRRARICLMNRPRHRRTLLMLRRSLARLATRPGGAVIPAAQSPRRAQNSPPILPTGRRRCNSTASARCCASPGEDANWR